MDEKIYKTDPGALEIIELLLYISNAYLNNLLNWLCGSVCTYFLELFHNFIASEEEEQGGADKTSEPTENEVKHELGIKLSERM